MIQTLDWDRNTHAHYRYPPHRTHLMVLYLHREFLNPQEQDPRYTPRLSPYTPHHSSQKESCQYMIRTLDWDRNTHAHYRYPPHRNHLMGLYIHREFLNPQEQDPRYTPRLSPYTPHHSSQKESCQYMIRTLDWDRNTHAHYRYPPHRNHLMVLYIHREFLNPQEQDPRYTPRLSPYTPHHSSQKESCQNIIRTLDWDRNSHTHHRYPPHRTHLMGLYLYREFLCPHPCIHSILPGISG